VCKPSAHRVQPPHPEFADGTSFLLAPRPDRRRERDRVPWRERRGETVREVVIVGSAAVEEALERPDHEDHLGFLHDLIAVGVCAVERENRVPLAAPLGSS
jgi:hypothetical protein